MFRNKKRLLSFILTLVLVLGMSVSAFAATIVDDTPPTDFVLTVAGADVSYMAVTVEGDDDEIYPDVTTYTAYIEFPSNSNANLSNLQVDAIFDDLEYNLEVNGTPYTPNMSVNFSAGYVNFTLKDFDGIEYKNYMINAGIQGTNKQIVVTIDLTNANAWLAGTYTSPNTGGYVVPTAVGYPAAAARVQDAVDGLENDLLTIPVLANIGDSAMDVFEDAVSAANLNLNVVGINVGYVSEIGRGGYDTLPDLLFQKTVGAPDFPSSDWEKDRTGWIYIMNNKVANVGASQYTITASDNTLTWGYTFDWGIDLGGPEW